MQITSSVHKPWLWLAIGLSLLLPRVASAGMITLDVSDTKFTPGTPFTVSVELPALTNLASYNIDILLSSSTGTAGTDFFFDGGATTAAPTNYVFPAADWFDATSNLDSSSTERLTLSDFDAGFLGYDVVPGVNNSLAQVVVSTLPGFTGELSLSIDTGGLLLDTPDFAPNFSFIPVVEFDGTVVDTSASSPVAIPSASTAVSAVPEPTSLSVFAIIGMAVTYSRRRHRNVTREAMSV
ncbi:PEP-CTERM sorting domain-containing protein [Roseimaritima ulvae]|uniref:PEP-CTERM protein-sorting domain-containing protein n=1 Tax=Roseimaritima ulvae TaxID=980254 RepID=A0A5B9QVN7_9BACT|nr:PEP-CTERM sorting domain-containing protein [Roseimaritima ulvae]QEG43104.1 hypothetical protein UC8_51480 [Roseimaritima ulvae]